MRYLSLLSIIFCFTNTYSQIFYLEGLVFNDSMGISRSKKIKELTTNDGYWYRYTANNKIWFEFTKVDSVTFIINEKRHNAWGDKKLYYSTISYVADSIQLIKQGRSYFFDADSIITDEGIYSYGKREGIFKKYNNGRLSRIETYTKGVMNGSFYSFYEDGMKKVQGEYKDGNRAGKWFGWYKNGRLISKGRYNGIAYTDSITEDDKIINGEAWESLVKQIKFYKCGRWVYYSEEGKKIKVELYRNDGSLKRMKQFIKADIKN